MEIENFSDSELISALRKTQVFARTTSEHKLRIVEALKRDKQVVAVTGDGINDAPALRTADIGVAMGIKGTDVAKEVADLILTDDNFAHLPDAVAVGRKAYDNFRKGITYYLSAKAVLLVVFVVPLLAGMPFPFAPIQIIAIELLMDLAS
jgi:Ca2+-transporting ATPase